LAALVLGSLAAACGSSHSAETPDAASPLPDASPDTAAPLDASVEASFDAASDAPDVEAAPEASFDASSDAPDVEAAPEASFDAGSDAPDEANDGFDVEPSALQTLAVTLNAQTPTLTYTATFDGQPVDVTWSFDSTLVGSVAAGPSSSTVVTPTGTAGGVATLSATLNGVTLQRTIHFVLSGTQNGANTSVPSEASQVAGSAAAESVGGGIGGVGGDGLGPATSNFPTTTSSPSAMDLTLLYPYDKTVWPRGLPAPLLMWSWTPGTADAIEIQLSDAQGYFTWTGTFGPPPVLSMAPATGTSFVRHPIPQDVWNAATNTASGTADPLTMTLRLARGGVAYGPLTSTWYVAPAPLPGVVYYTGYATEYLKNWTTLDAAGNPIGAGILVVEPGSLSPSVVAGENSPLDTQGNPSSNAGCRACHTVASQGRWLLAQANQGTPSDGVSILYDLSQPSASLQSTAVTLNQQGTFGLQAMTGDGSYSLTGVVDPSSSDPDVSSAQSTFWNFLPTQPPSGMSPTTQPAQGTLTGLPSGVAAAFPAFSPDDTLIAYTSAASDQADIAGEPLVEASYDATTQTFSNPQTIFAPATGTRIGLPSFLPDDSGIVFESQTRKSCQDTVLVTRDGARSALWWVNTTNSPQAVALATLNGTGYLPTGGNDHGGALVVDTESSCYASESGLDDTTLAYEPAVFPSAAGGFAWVVFTSRRLYGNELTELPWLSWPPDYNTRDLSQAPVKKLWIAAIDLNAPAGSDPSHPAFYLPGQELLGANSRARPAPAP
jgi:hypothetical protein